MNGWTAAAFLVGWILGVWMSHRKIKRGRADHAKLLELVRAHKELREKIEKRDENVVDFPGGNNKTEH